VRALRLCTAGVIAAAVGMSLPADATTRATVVIRPYVAAQQTFPALTSYEPTGATRQDFVVRPSDCADRSVTWCDVVPFQVRVPEGGDFQLHMDVSWSPHGTSCNGSVTCVPADGIDLFLWSDEPSGEVLIDQNRQEQSPTTFGLDATSTSRFELVVVNGQGSSPNQGYRVRWTPDPGQHAPARHSATTTTRTTTRVGRRTVSTPVLGAAASSATPMPPTRGALAVGSADGSSLRGDHGGGARGPLLIVALVAAAPTALLGGWFGVARRRP
jgi:hypothetical protein